MLTKENMMTLTSLLQVCDPKELIEVMYVVKDIYTAKTKLEKKQKIKEFSVGDIVEFSNNNKGFHKGEVIKVNITNLKVKEGLVTWTVPANLARKVR